ncbi:MAG: DUF3653 domain-containing protein [Rudaea sp.]
MDSIKPPCRANGAPSNPCYSRVHDQIAEHRFDLTGAWSGWKLRAGKLVSPFGRKFAPAQLEILWTLRHGLIDALIADALHGPTIFDQLREHLHTVRLDATNDDASEFATECTQTRLPGL